MKNFLSVFRDWKVYLRGSRKLSRENLCVPLATGPFTRKQVAKINTRSRGEARDLDDPRLSRQNRATLFLKFFLAFVKTKYFPKTPKTLKNLFVFESTKIEHIKTHFNKFNHTNEYGIH